MNEQFRHFCNDVIADVDDDNADHDDNYNDADDNHHDTHDHYHDADNSKPFVHFGYHPHNRSSSLSRQPTSKLMQKSYPMTLSDNHDDYSNNDDHNAHHGENL